MDHSDTVLDIDNETKETGGLATNNSTVDEDGVILVDDEISGSNNTLYCTGIVPANMKDEIYNLFPFQLLPELQDVVFSGDAIHHVECMKNNYQLPADSRSTVNILCSKLLQLKQVQSVVNRSEMKFDQLKDYNNKYLNHRQLSDKSKHYHVELNRSKLELVRLRSRINKIGESVSLHQRLLVEIANNNVPRLNQLVAVALRNNRGISYILSKVTAAIQGVYNARPSDDDKDLALLVLEFGGPSLLDILYKANYLPSVSTGYEMRQKSKKIKSTIGSSFPQLMEDNTTLNEENSSYAFSIKADETFVTARPRYDSKEDLIQGLCSSHGVAHMKFDTYEEAENLCEAVKNGTVHVPTEVTVVGGCSMDDCDPVQIVCALPTCDKKDFDGGLEMFKQLSEE